MAAMSAPAAAEADVVRVEQECERCARVFMRKPKANRQKWCGDCSPVRRNEYQAAYRARYLPNWRAKRKESAR